jgi:hypothetical protein
MGSLRDLARKEKKLRPNVFIYSREPLDPEKLKEAYRQGAKRREELRGIFELDKERSSPGHQIYRAIPFNVEPDKEYAIIVDFEILSTGV